MKNKYVLMNINVRNLLIIDHLNRIWIPKNTIKRVKCVFLLWMVTFIIGEWGKILSMNNRRIRIGIELLHWR
jgi:hypothetical protein